MNKFLQTCAYPSKTLAKSNWWLGQYGQNIRPCFMAKWKPDNTGWQNLSWTKLHRVLCIMFYSIHFTRHSAHSSRLLSTAFMLQCAKGVSEQGCNKRYVCDLGICKINGCELSLNSLVHFSVLGIAEMGPTPPFHLENGANGSFCGPRSLTLKL